MQPLKIKYIHVNDRFKEYYTNCIIYHNKYSLHG